MDSRPSSYRRPTRVIVLMGGTDFWSNGIHLNTIEAADDPAHESWRNVQAMNDLVREIITTESHLVISALQGNAGAGGVILALAADFVFGRKGIVLNPHYKGMGNLYGSEYWTYLLPKRVGEEKARELTEALLPLSSRTAQQIGLIDDAFEEDAASFREHIRKLAEELASSHRYEPMLEEKRQTRKNHEERKPLQAYRNEELQRMWINFFGADRSYHMARKNFVYKGLVPYRDRDDAGFERGIRDFLNGARQFQAMKDAELVDVLSSRLDRTLDGITVSNQRVTTIVGERA